MGRGREGPWGSGEVLQRDGANLRAGRTHSHHASGVRLRPVQTHLGPGKGPVQHQLNGTGADVLALHLLNKYTNNILS